MNLTGKRILIPGGAGFLGRHVCRALDACHPAAVLVPRSATCDLRCPLAVDGLFLHFRPDIVLHLAATCGGIGVNLARPADFLHDNLVMGLNVLDAARRFKVEKVVNIGTTCSYPAATPIPMREELLWDGYPEASNAPYGLAKRLVIEYGQTLRRQYGLNVVSLILANLYGSGDSFDPATSHVIPALIRKMAEARDAGANRVTLWGDGTATRDLLYVEDAAAGIVAAAERYDGAAPVNLGSGYEVAIGHLALLIAHIVSFTGDIWFDHGQPNGQQRRCLETSRAKREFGWRATTELTEGLRRTVDYFNASLAVPALV